MTPHADWDADTIHVEDVGADGTLCTEEVLIPHVTPRYVPRRWRAVLRAIGLSNAIIREVAKARRRGDPWAWTSPAVTFPPGEPGVMYWPPTEWIPTRLRRA